MTRKEWVAAFHNPAATEQPMVASIWEDGEYTLEKGGELFGHRILHMIAPACVAPWPLDLFPAHNEAGTHARIFVDYERVKEALAAMKQCEE